MFRHFRQHGYGGKMANAIFIRAVQKMKPLLTKEEISELLAPLTPEPGTGSPADSVDSISGGPALVRLEFKCSKTVRQELLQTQKGSILALEKFTEPLELFLDDQLVARGEFGQATDGNTAIILTKVYILPK